MLKKLIPLPVRLFLRTAQHNRRYSKLSLQESFQLALHQLGVLDYEHTKLFMHVGAYEELDHLRTCAREPETVAWIEEFVKEGDVFYDIGANVGAFSLIAAKILEKSGSVYGFEPSFSTYASLSLNLAHNMLSPCIKPLQIALADETKLQYFQYSNLAAGQALHALEADADAPSRIKSVHTQAVLTYTLDEFLRIFKISLPTHIKIDVDGEEEKVLRGAYNTLRSPSLKSVLIEIDESLPNHEMLTHLILSAGFAVAKKVQKKREHMFNCIFSRI